ncbi:MAG: hypothetical protein MMC33_001572 [Icmadophila ericetorum]|nr:hypothetical protein [Icmadophila ericetorum]
MGNHSTATVFQPGYSIVENPGRHLLYRSAVASGKRFLVNKEELGHEREKGECDYDVLPNIAAYDLVKPALLFPDPIRTFDSWKSLAWNDIESLIQCYEKLYQMRTIANDKSYTLIYERLVQKPRTEVERLCSGWRVPYQDRLINLGQPFGAFYFNTERERAIYCQESPLGLFTTVQSHQKIMSNIQSHSLLTNDEKESIKDRVGKQYMALWGDKVSEVKAILQSKTWFAFDLDDTLHEFRKASGTAVAAIFCAINEKYSVPTEELKSGLELLDELALVYETALGNALALKCGALSLLKQVKSKGKKIAIITEDPQDAQEWTVEQLGLKDMVDFLATTNFFVVSKVDGLFGKVLEQLKADASDMVVIGDSKERDIAPVMAQGIYAIYYAEAENFSLDLEPPQINSLKKLEFILLPE